MVLVGGTFSQREYGMLVGLRVLKLFNGPKLVALAMFHVSRCGVSRYRKQLKRQQHDEECVVTSMD